MIEVFSGAAFWTTPDDIPETPGAYVLMIGLRESVVLKIRNVTAALAPGTYLYCGSAKGPGGLRARVARHMRTGKSMHWHVDHLTESGTVLGAWAFAGGNECDLVASLSRFPFAVKGFGSSDCRSCVSHLLRCPRPA